MLIAAFFDAGNQRPKISTHPSPPFKGRDVNTKTAPSACVKCALFRHGFCCGRPAAFCLIALKNTPLTNNREPRRSGQTGTTSGYNNGRCTERSRSAGGVDGLPRPGDALMRMNGREQACVRAIARAGVHKTGLCKSEASSGPDAPDTAKQPGTWAMPGRGLCAGFTGIDQFLKK